MARGISPSRPRLSFSAGAFLRVSRDGQHRSRLFLRIDLPLSLSFSVSLCVSLSISLYSASVLVPPSRKRSSDHPAEILFSSNAAIRFLALRGGSTRGLRVLPLRLGCSEVVLPSGDGALNHPHGSGRVVRQIHPDDTHRPSVHLVFPSLHLHQRACTRPPTRHLHYPFA